MHSVDQENACGYQYLTLGCLVGCTCMYMYVHVKFARTLCMECVCVAHLGWY